MPPTPRVREVLEWCWRAAGGRLEGLRVGTEKLLHFFVFLAKFLSSVAKL